MRKTTSLKNRNKRDIVPIEDIKTATTEETTSLKNTHMRRATSVKKIAEETS